MWEGLYAPTSNFNSRALSGPKAPPTFAAIEIMILPTRHRWSWITLCATALLLAGCGTTPQPSPPVPPRASAPATTAPAPAPVAPKPASTRPLTPPVVKSPRTGDEIIVAGEVFHTGTRVVTWLDRGGYNGYLVPPPPKNADKAAAAVPPAPLFNERRLGVNGPVVPPDLAGLRGFVDQFVLHYDECGLSKLCFDVLQQRGLSVHFLLDVDGTIYQTLDLRERAWHATTSNDRSIGIEIANIGARSPSNTSDFKEWYEKKKNGQVRIDPPLKVGNPRYRTPNYVGRPLRNEPVRGSVQGRSLVQYDFTPEQYAALIKLTATLNKVFPKMRLDYPSDAKGKLISHKLPDDALAKFTGIIAHFHIQDNKIDPGPAFQWDLLINGARKIK